MNGDNEKLQERKHAQHPKVYDTNAPGKHTADMTSNKKYYHT
jgi:hypothetical protein